MKKELFCSNANTIKTALLSGAVGGLLVLIVLFTAVMNNWIVLNETANTNTQVSVSAMDVANIVEDINPAVVSIVITKDVPIMEKYYTNPFGNYFGFSVPQYRQNGTEEKEIGGGSGFFVSEDGYVVTNAHVISDTDASYTVFTIDEKQYAAEVIAMDEYLDVAVLKVEGDAFPHLKFGDSNELRLGQAVIAIGNALAEFRNTVSTGVISGLSREIEAYGGADLENIIQTDAAINQGNSGGPLLDLTGNVIGVNVAVASNSENIGFALPADAVKESVESIIEHGKVITPYIGIRYLQVNEIIAQANNLDTNHGALILRGENIEDLAIVPGSPADKAGLEEYDIILEIDGEQITLDNTITDILRDKDVGQTITLKYLHDGEEQTTELILGEQE